MLFYEKPTPLRLETHRGLKLNRSEGDYRFAARTNSVLLAAVEFFEAAKEYPIAFSRVGDKEVVPVAVLGLRADENLLVDAEGRWDGRYIPAFVRRYPFVSADTGGGELTVCVDEACPGLNAAEGQPLFDAEGKPSPLLKQAMDLLRDYHQQSVRTLEFAKRLDELGLLKPMSAVAELKDGTRAVLDGVLVVDEIKLAALKDEVVLELFRSGGLALVFAHLGSLANLGRLLDRLAQRSATSVH